MTHPLTHAFATVLHRADVPADYEPACLAIEALTTGYSDDKKADLYALIQEAVNRDMAFVELSDTLDRCLNQNDLEFQRC